MDRIVAVNLLDAHSLLSSFGAVGIFLIMVAETGLLIGIFLPGDSLLFTAGLLCTTTAHDSLHLSLPSVLIAAIAGALLGAQLGYVLGRWAGPALGDSPRHRRVGIALDRARMGIERYGPAKAIALARFIPFVRTVMNPLAGAIKIPAGLFTRWQVGSGVVWAAGLTLAGYGLGSQVPNVDRYLLPIIAVIVILSLVPIVLEARKSQRKR